MTKEINVALRGSQRLSVPGTRGSSLVARDAAVLAATMGRVYPFAMEKGLGSEVWDVDGNRYLDMAAGIAVISTGHSHPAVRQAMHTQIDKFVHMAGTDFVNEQMVNVAEKLAATMPGPDEWQVFLSNSGTEAIEAAIKLARHATGRQGISSVLGAFHGRSYGAMSLTASKSTQRRGHMPLVPGTFHAFYANPYRTPFGIAPEHVTQAALDYIEKTLFATVIHPSDMAAIVVEPIQGEGGINIPPDGYLEGLRKICDEAGALLMFDEVQCGMGRTGKWFGYQHFNVEPDIMTVAKALASGVAAGVMMARSEVAEVLKPGMHASTYGGNPIACRAGLATIETIEEDGLLDQAKVLEDKFRKVFTEIQHERPELIKEIRIRGVMVGVDLTCDASPIVAECLNRNLLINATQGHVIRLLPALNLSDELFDEGCSILRDVLMDHKFDPDQG